MSAPGRLDVGIVGAGRVGAVLGAALRSVEHRVVAVSATSEASLERAAALLPGVPVREVPDVVAGAQLVVLAVPADELEALVSGLARVGAFRPGQLVAHTAGRFGCDVLTPAADAGAIALALHPAMAFTGYSLDLPRLQACPWAVTAAAPVLPIAQALVVELGGEPVVLEESARPAYDAVLAHGAHVATVASQALRALRSLGVEDSAGMLRPLLRTNLDAVLRGGEGGLTGPVARGDARTIAAHVAALDELADAERFPDGVAPAGDLPGRSVLGGRGLDDVPPTHRRLVAACLERAEERGALSRAQVRDVREALGGAVCVTHPCPDPAEPGE